MAERDRDSLSLRRAGWPAALVILGVALVLELLPYVGGTGEAARFDWSWMYVTGHFIVLPLACLLHIVVNIYRVAVLYRSQRSAALRAISSLVIPVGYLLLLYLNPVLPLSSELSFEDVRVRMGV